ncbi:vomeronasal type-1 receptor 4-like [Grammomys surdaster]|uniref:vomeronasal type-1 receptor 4-like n=1 Tax=Grammomys surdaster TaxID=491861 RepID=UPI00109F18DE|nr:vomeronasal type-1 receptor 4-like [Grammomys surdaster]
MQPVYFRDKKVAVRLPICKVKKKLLSISGRIHCEAQYLKASIVFPYRIGLIAGCNTMAASEVAVGVIFLSQTVVGFLGNSFLFHHYLLFNFRRCRLRSRYWIVMHLTIANILTLLCKGIPQTMASFGLKDFLNDFGCKGLFYLYEVGRGVSIGSTTFLSVFQAITISPLESRWAQLKERRQKHIGSSVYLSWILYMLSSSFNLVHVRAKYSKNNTENLKDMGYCVTATDKISDVLYAALFSVPDFLFMGLMVWASTVIVLILHRHKQRIHHMSKVKVSSRTSPESKAIQTILLLVSTFVFFYTLSCIFTVCITLSSHHRWLLVNAFVLLAGCFPTVSPFLILQPESTTHRGFCFISRKK